MKKERKKHPVLRRTILCVLGLIIIAGLIFMRFGGFGTGESADQEALTAFAGTVDDIVISENVAIVALGEATHGNSEFQKLKLNVFKRMVEDYGVRALALEGDYGGCEQVNRYIHGGQGTAQEAAADIGFAIYRTEEMAELIAYMRQYNESAAEGEDLRFYGFDMQRCVYSFEFLMEECAELGVNTASLKKLVDGDDWSAEYDNPTRIEIITQVKNELSGKENSAQAVHFADMLLQFCELQNVADGDYIAMRDSLMAENVMWISEQEREIGHERIFVTGHNGHVARWGSYDSMGKLLAKELGDGYYTIGTDFYKTNCNLPKGSSGSRTNQVFYSHDPLAKAAKSAGLDICWIDFTKAAESPELAALINEYVYMGSLGEGYSWYMRILPQSYRIYQPPAELYNGMIFVAEANPTEIVSAE